MAQRSPSTPAALSLSTRGSTCSSTIGVNSSIQRSQDVLARLDATARRELAPHEVPRRWELLEALPRTASSKVQRGRLREQLER